MQDPTQQNTKHLNLYNYNDIYFPEDGFYNTNPFPPEWMEMFHPFDP